MNSRSLIVLAVVWLPVSLFAANNTTIPTVIVKHHKTDHFQLHHSNYVTVITAKQIRASAASNIAEVLANRADVQLQDTSGDGHISVSMRGFGANASQNTLILINGIPQDNIDLGGPNLNRIPIQNVEHIEIIKGSQGVRYGDQAVGGVINIITKTPKKSQSHVSVGYGSYNHQIYHYDVSNRYHNGFSYLVSADKNKTDNYRQHNNDDQNHLHLALGYQYDTGKLNFQYTFYNQRLLYAGALTQQQVQQDRRQAQNTANNGTTFLNNLHLNWQQAAGDNWLITTNLANRNDDEHGFLFGDFEQRRHTLLFAPTAIGFIGKTKLTLGTDTEYEDYHNQNSISITDIQETTASAFGLVHQPLFDHLALTAGLRGARQNADNHALVSEIGLGWHINKEGLLYAKHAGNYRFPKAEEQSYRAQGSAPLKTQTGASDDLGFKWMAKQYHIQIDLYTLHLNHEIAYDPTPLPSQPQGANRNLPPTNRYGANLGVTLPINDTFSIGAEYSYVDARFDSGVDKGNKIPFVANNTVRAFTSLHFAHYWMIYSELLYTGKRYPSGDDANNGHIVPAQTIVNGSVSYMRKRFSVSCRLNNIFNAYYNSYVTAIDLPGQPAIEYFYPAPGRNVIVTASVKLW